MRDTLRRWLAVRAAARLVHGQRDRRRVALVALACSSTTGPASSLADGRAVPRRQVPAGAPRAVPHRPARPARRPPHRCRWLYLAEALVFVALAPIVDERVLARARCSLLGARRRRPRADGRGADARRDRRDPAAGATCCARATRSSTSASRSPRVGGSALGGLLVAEFGLAAALLADAALLRRHRRRARATAATCPRRTASARAARSSGCAAASRSRARDPRVRLLLGGQAVALILFTLIIPIEVDLRQGDARDDERRLRRPARRVGRRIVLGSLLFVGAAQALRRAAHPALDRARSASPTSAWRCARELCVACVLSVLGGTATGSSGCR